MRIETITPDYIKQLEREATEAALSSLIKHPLESVPASFPAELRWYAFQTYPRAEKQAKDAIQELDFEVFVPFERKKRHKQGRSYIFEQAYFTSYGFVRMDINNGGWGAIVTADGVVDILRNTGVPMAVPDAVVDGLKVMESLGLFDKTAPFVEGVQVEVTDGPFRDLIGKVERARANERADVLFRGLFGAERRVTLPVYMLRKV